MGRGQLALLPGRAAVAVGTVFARAGAAALAVCAPAPLVPGRVERLRGRDGADRRGRPRQQVVHAHPAGTTYLVKAGTHLRYFNVTPRSGDTF